MSTGPKSSIENPLCQALHKYQLEVVITSSHYICQWTDKRQKAEQNRDLHKNQSFNNLYCTEIVYALEREENHVMYVPYWFYCSKAPKGAQVMITIIQSENNIWDRKWQKGEKIKQKAHREKDTVAPQQT